MPMTGIGYKGFDDYRHEVIHGDSLGKGISHAADEVDYLMRTVLFFMGLVNCHYGLTLNPHYSVMGKGAASVATAQK